MIGERGLFMNTMHIEAIEVGPAASNCYLLWGEAQEALVVDPGAEGPQIVDVLRRHELKVAAYTLTHAHIDHIGALAEVVRIFPAPVGMHPSDLRFAFTSRNTLPPFYPTPAEAVDIAREYAEGQEWIDGGLAYRVLHTPGHSPGHVIVNVESKGERGAFIGDLMHHPIQVPHPEWSTCFCWDLEMSAASRTAFVDTHTDAGTLVLPVHFAGATAGRIHRDGDTQKFTFLNDPS